MNKMNASNEDFGAEKGARNKYISVTLKRYFQMSIKCHLPSQYQQHLQHTDPRWLDCKLQNMACNINSTKIKI